MRDRATIRDLAPDPEFEESLRVSPSAAPPKQSVPTREEIDVAHRWSLEDLFATPRDWEDAYEATEVLVEKLSAERDAFR